MKTLNALNQTDGYKTGHFVQYPEGTEVEYRLDILEADKEARHGEYSTN